MPKSKKKKVFHQKKKSFEYKWTIKQKMQCAQWFDEYKSVTLVRREYRRMFNEKSPSTTSIRSWHQKLMETGNVLDKKITGRPSLSHEIVDMVRKDYLRSPEKSARKRAQELGLCHTSVSKILNASSPLSSVLRDYSQI
ncbi:unnamed protein product [Meganyctiphanes norvegica]|uniref:DUF4817 domain-containing protein n=1 Tax=Meganyctiphanes norvegica TaxID=48144 RepID=A0AAV2S0Y8_MEGNR